MIRGLVVSLSLLATVAAIAATGAGQPSLYPDSDVDTGARPLKTLALSADGRLIAVSGADGLVSVWDAQAARVLRQARGSGSAASRMAFDPAGTRLMVGTDGGEVFILDLRTGETRVVTRHAKAVTAVAFAPDGALAASGDASGDIALADPGGAGEPAHLREDGHTKPILALGFGDATTLMSVGRDLKVIAWDCRNKRAVRRGTLQAEKFGRGVEPWTAVLDSSGSLLGVSAQLVTASHRAFFNGGFGGAPGGGGTASATDMARANVVIPYSVQTGVAAEAVRTGPARPELLALTPGGCFAAFTGAAGGGHALYMWSLSGNGQSVEQLDLPARPVAVALDAAGRHLAVGLESGRAMTWTVSGATAADCEALRNRSRPGGAMRVALGSETAPLIVAGAGQRIAVLGFEAGGVEAHVADAVREMVAGELANSAHVQVIERAAIDALLREMEIQHSGLTAADAARIGRGLNARKVLFGSVRRFGDHTYVVLARIVDVETQQVEGSRQVSCENCAEGDLLQAVQALRQAIVP